MEKIYMEESQQQGQKQRQQQKQQQGLYRFSIVLSFAVAFFAVFSLASFGIAVSQNTGVSYAAPVTSDEFTFYLGQFEGAPERIAGETPEGDVFNVPAYYSDANYANPIFCIEQHAEVASNGPLYIKGSEINDYGLLYILNNSNLNGGSIVNGNPTIEKWATQVAIWLYLSDKYPNEKIATGTKAGQPLHKFSDTDLAIIKKANRFYRVGQTEAAYVVNGVYEKIEKFVTEAKNQRPENILEINTAKDELSKTTDDKYYQTSLITIVGNPAGSLKNYSINVTGIDGVKVIDENGTEIKTLTGIAPSTKFHILIPADQVTTTAKQLNVEITGTFDYLTGNIYTAKVNAELQKVVTVTGTTRQQKAGISLEIVGTPNTGMSTSQTIYFIGLIVLLCGVGIVYANAKPVESKQ